MRTDETWTCIHDKLKETISLKAGKVAQPSASIIDSQSVKTASRVR